MPIHPEAVPRAAARRSPLWTVAIVAVSVAAGLLVVGLMATAAVFFWSRARSHDAKPLDASSEAGMIGGLRVSVRSVEVGEVPFRGMEGRTDGSKHLKITLVVENPSETRRLDYRGWGWPHSTLLEPLDAYLAGVTDNFGNRCSVHPMKTDGQVTVTSIDPGQTITDLLVYQVPVEKAEYLTLSLPGKNVGVEGRLLFKIPRQMFAP